MLEGGNQHFQRTVRKARAEVAWVGSEARISVRWARNPSRLVPRPITTEDCFVGGHHLDRHRPHVRVPPITTRSLDAIRCPFDPGQAGERAWLIRPIR